MKAITVRNIDADLADALRRESHARRKSINSLILEFLRNSLFPGSEAGPRRPYRDLDSLAGTWTPEEARSFEDAVAPFERIEEDLWK